MPTMNLHMDSTDGARTGNDSTVANAFAGFSTYVGGQRSANADVDLNVFMAPEFLYGNKARGSGDIASIKTLAGALSTGHGNSLVFPGTVIQKKGVTNSKIKNRVPIFYNGTEVLLHSKRNWGGAQKADGKGGKAAFKGGQKDAYFTIKVGTTTYACGIEICMDHQFGELKKNLASLQKSVDLHFILGNMVGAAPANMCGTKFTILCNANQTSKMASTACQVYNSAKTKVNASSMNVGSACWLGLAI